MTNAKKSKFVIGIFFKDLDSLSKYLKKKEMEFEKQGYIQMEDFLDKYRVVEGKQGLLLIGNPDKK